MAKLLLMNPKRRKHARKGPSAAQKRARAAFVARYGRRSNPAAPRRAARSPVVVMSNPVSRRRRRRNPVTALPAVRQLSRRRRRNPIGLGSMSTYVDMLKNAAIGGAGAVVVDLAMGQINKYLPLTLQSVPGTIDLGTAAKAAITAVLGKLLNGPTRGLSMKAAQASLIVQAHAVIAAQLPGTMTLGYASPARIVSGNNRIGPNRMGRYTRPGVTPVLSQYMIPGQTPLLSGFMPAGSLQQRETTLR